MTNLTCGGQDRDRQEEGGKERNQGRCHRRCVLKSAEEFPSHPEKEGLLVSWNTRAELQSGGMKGLAYWELRAVWQKVRLVDWAR